MVAAGCRFFAGYPMTPFTEVLEHMARLLPDVGGVCMNAESELEAVGMAWGAAATGTPAATGSTGQGLSLMQESLAEITLARLPLVVLDMARAQGDYYQATRGGGHGDYRHLVLAPADSAEAVELIGHGLRPGRAVAQPGAGHGRLLPGPHRPVGRPSPIRSTRPVPEWALDGSTRRVGPGQAGLVPRAAPSSATTSATTWPSTTRPVPRHTADMARRVEPLAEVTGTDDAEVVVVAFGTPARYVQAAVRELRAEGAPRRMRAPDHAVPFPDRGRGRAAEGRGPWPSTRTTRDR